jgi:hypothetical protein
MDLASVTSPRITVRVLAAVSLALLVDISLAVYAESAVAASLGWPLILMTVVATVVAVLDGVRRLSFD